MACDPGTELSDTAKGIGVMLGLLGSIGINLGNNMQSLGMNKTEKVRQLEEEVRNCPQHSKDFSSRRDDPGTASAPNGSSAHAGAAVALAEISPPPSPPPSPPATASSEPEQEHDYNAPENQPADRLSSSLVDGAGESAAPAPVLALTPEPPACRSKPERRALSGESPTRERFDPAAKLAKARKGVSGKLIHQAGTVIFISGSVINFIAFALAPASVLAPLESVQFVSNLIFARLFNPSQANITRQMVVGSALVVGGTVVAVTMGPQAVAEFGVQELIDFWTAPAWIVYEIFIFAAAAAVQLVWQMHQTAVLRGRPMLNHVTILPVCYALSSAMIGTQSVVQAKCLSELVSILFAGSSGGSAPAVVEGCNATGMPPSAPPAPVDTRGAGEIVFTSWFTYFVIGYFLVSVGFWLYRLNAALKKYDPLFIIPLLQASYIVFATVGGGTYFQELQTMGPVQWVLFVLGLLTMLVGLYLLTPKNRPPPDPELPDRTTIEEVRV